MNAIRKIGGKIKRSKIKFIIFTVIAVFCAATIYAAAANSYTVEINIDSNTTKVTTMRNDANAVLAQAEIEIGEKDIVDFSDFEAGVDCTIYIYRPHEVVIHDDNEIIKGTGIRSVEQALNDNGVVLTDGDNVNVELDDPLYDGIDIYITRAFEVTVEADGEISTVKLSGGLVSDALDKAIFTLDDDDILSHSLDTKLEKGMAIKVTRVNVLERTETEKIKAKTVTEKTDSLYVGQSKIKVKGVDGEKTVTYSEKYVDGKKVESKVVKTEVTKQAVNTVKLVGSKKRPAVSGSLASNAKTISNLKAPSNVKLKGNIPVSYKKKIVGTASAYSGGGITATGKTVQNGYIAVNPRQIPYGTKMWIVSNDGKYVYGYASAEDTGGFVNWTGSRATVCDLYFSSESQASMFGRRGVTIYIL